MELTTTQETAQPIFGRTHLTLTCTFDASVPARGLVAQRISEQRSVKPELIVIRTITPRFGGSTATIDAYVYEDAAKLKELESQHFVDRTKKTIPEDAPAESVEEAVEAAEAPVEEAEEPAEDEKNE